MTGAIAEPLKFTLFWLFIVAEVEIDKVLVSHSVLCLFKDTLTFVFIAINQIRKIYFIIISTRLDV